MTCKQCKNYDECQFDAACNDAVFDPDASAEYCTGAEPITNADRIRAMRDEELAEFLILSPEMEFDVCRLCKLGNPTPRDDRGQCLGGYGACDAESRAEAFKEWLKQPAGEE